VVGCVVQGHTARSTYVTTVHVTRVWAGPAACRWFAAGFAVNCVVVVVVAASRVTTRHRRRPRVSSASPSKIARRSVSCCHAGFPVAALSSCFRRSNSVIASASLSGQSLNLLNISTSRRINPPVSNPSSKWPILCRVGVKLYYTIPYLCQTLSYYSMYGKVKLYIKIWRTWFCPKWVCVLLQPNRVL